MMQPYLKCKYEQKFYNHEYLVTIEGCDEEIFVNKEDIIPLNKKSGLVKICYIESNGDEKSKILINNNLKSGLSTLTIPTKKIFFHKEDAKQIKKSYKKSLKND